MIISNNESMVSSSFSANALKRTNLDYLRKEPIIHPSTINLKAVRCPICNHLLGFIDGRSQIKCHKCKHLHLSDDTRVAPTTNALI